MKLFAEDRVIDRVGTQKETAYTIKPTGKAFRILSSGLYKEKIHAIVRELSCNAYDAHIDAGKLDVPFDIHLPNAIEPWFTVRDKGKGLSPEGMETTYTRYFESTKTDSDDFIGALGLGSKSPLSYTDSFDVASFFEGIKSMYTVSMDEDGTPTLTHRSDEPSDEPSGLEVKIPVGSSYDFREFREKAERVFRYFPVKPNIVGSPDYTIEDRTPVLEGDGWKVYPSGPNFAIMGVVAYPLSLRSVSQAGADDTVRPFENLSIEIDFPIGSLDITAGREELSFDKRTIANMTARLGNIRREIIRKILLDFSKCETEVEVRKLYGSTLGSNSALARFMPSGKVPWKGRMIDSAHMKFKPSDYKGAEITMYSTGYGRSHKATVTRDIFTAMADTSSLSIPLSGVTFVEDDGVKTHRLARCRKYVLDAKSSQERLVVLGGDPETEGYKKMMERFTGVTMRKLSELEKPDAPVRSKITPKQLTNSQYETAQYRAYNWQGVEIEDMDEGYYFVTNASRVVVKDAAGVDQFINTDTMWSMYRNAIQAGLFNNDPKAQITLYTVPTSVAKVIKADARFVDFFTHIRERCAEMMAGEVGQSITQREMHNTVERKYDINSGPLEHLMSALTSMLPTDHTIVKLMDEKKKHRSLTPMQISLSNLAISLGIQAAEAIEPPTEELWLNIEQRYPLMKQLPETWYRHSKGSLLSNVVEYFRAMDAINAGPQRPKIVVEEENSPL
jgi:hypothetical protein